MCFHMKFEWNNYSVEKILWSVYEKYIYKKNTMVHFVVFSQQYKYNTKTESI